MRIHVDSPTPTTLPLSTSFSSSVPRAAEEGSTLSSLHGKPSSFTRLVYWVMDLLEGALGFFLGNSTDSLYDDIKAEPRDVAKKYGEKPKGFFENLISGILEDPTEFAEQFRDRKKEWKDLLKGLRTHSEFCSFVGEKEEVLAKQTIFSILIKSAANLQQYFKRSPEMSRIFLISLSKSLAHQLQMTPTKAKEKETVAELVAFFSTTLPETIASQKDEKGAALAKHVQYFIGKVLKGSTEVPTKDMDNFFQDLGMYHYPIPLSQIYAALSSSRYWQESSSIDFSALICTAFEDFLLEGGKTFSSIVLKEEKERDSLTHLLANKLSKLCLSPRQISGFFQSVPSAFAAYNEEQKEDKKLDEDDV